MQDYSNPIDGKAEYPGHFWVNIICLTNILETIFYLWGVIAMNKTHNQPV